MRFIHNFFQMFRKDNGAYFTYNLGVGFVRTAGVLFGIAALLFVYSQIAPPPVLRKLYKTPLTLENVYSDVRRTYSGRSRSYREKIVYKAHFTGDVEDFTQELTQEQYISMLKKEGTTRNYYVYQLIEGGIYEGGYYASELTTDGARVEYGKVHRRSSAYTAEVLSFYALLGALVIFGIGAGQEKLAMKYPRNDVELSGTAITPEQQAETDELMREFDEAFDKFQHNRQAGLPTSVPPRTDGKYRLEQRRDTDENRSDSEETDI